MKLVVVTASTNPNRAVACLSTWGPVEKIVVLNGPEAQKSDAWRTHVGNVTTITASNGAKGQYLGVVPAFNLGVDLALQGDAEIIACLHDDVEIHDPSWVEKVVRKFTQQPACGLLGFGGAIGLGAQDMYEKPYDPMSLARVGFRSNMVDAEVHGVRSLLSEKVACLDGFSQIGRRAFWLGIHRPETRPGPEQKPWHVLADLGIQHHLYDGLLGAIAARYGWETWYLPIRCRHLGGQTAVGDQGYQAWAQTKIEGGDHGFWEASHKAGYEGFKDVLPLRV